MTKETNRKEPLVRIAKRNDIKGYQKFFLTIICLLVAVAISILFLWVVGGKDPIQALLYIVEGSFKLNSKGEVNLLKIWPFLQEVTILLAIGLALIPAFKMKFWNIGATGQVLMGGLLTTACMIYLPSWFGNDIPNVVILIVGAILAVVAGAIWGWIPAFFKAKFNTNETLFTLMLNYIASLLVLLCTDIWRGSNTSLGLINSATELGWFPTITVEGLTYGSQTILSNNAVLVPLCLTLLLVITTFVYIRYTKHGYEIQVVGGSIETARYSGINVSHVIRRTVALSGGLCGIIGFFLVSNFGHSISSTLDNGYGFTAIIVCWLSGFNPFLMILYSALIIFLTNGATNLSNVSYSENLNQYSTQFIVFFIIISIMLATFFSNYRLLFRKNAKRMKARLTKGLVMEVKA